MFTPVQLTTTPQPIPPVRPPAAPRPIPGPFDPARLVDVALVELTEHVGNGPYVSELHSVLSLTKDNSGWGESTWRERNMSTEKFTPFVGSFDDAVRAANRLVLGSVGDGDHKRWKGHHAHAVIDAGDGSWYLTGLGRFSRGVHVESVDRGLVSVIDVRPLHPSVSAVVGAATYFDFRTGASREHPVG